MNLELLKAGLQKLVNEDNNNEAKQAIAEINEIQQRSEWNDPWKGECYVLHAQTVSDLLNETTYDAYGKLYVRANRIGHMVSFNDYEKVCREQHGLEYAPLSIIQIGYDYIRELYADNDCFDCHKADGTFNYNTSGTTTDLNEMFKLNGLKILREVVGENVAELLDITENEPTAEPANERLAVLTNLLNHLDEMI